MKNYTITVNGNVYDVVVEEGTSAVKSVVKAPGQAPVKTEVPVSAPVSAPAPTAPVSTPATPEVVKKPEVAVDSVAGSVRIEAGAAGKIFKLDAKVGQTVKRGDSIVVLEAMKMEIPVVAPSDGVVSSIDVTVGDAVEAGALLATLK